jgi:ABC-2 type transport system permease protein
MATLVVRIGTAAWVLWEINTEVRFGLLGRRLLRPVHPLVHYACEQVAAWPFRFLVVSPIIVAAFAWLGFDVITDDPVQIALLPLVLLGTWVMTFCVMAIIGTLAFFAESSLAVFDLWLGFYVVLSGYVMPLDLFPAGVRAVVDWLPFRYMLSFPVETLLGLMDREATLRALAGQWAYVAAMGAVLLLLWRAGVKRFAAYGG